MNMKDELKISLEGCILSKTLMPHPLCLLASLTFYGGIMWAAISTIQPKK